MSSGKLQLKSLQGIVSEQEWQARVDLAWNVHTRNNFTEKLTHKFVTAPIS